MKKETCIPNFPITVLMQPRNTWNGLPWSEVLEGMNGS